MAYKDEIRVKSLNIYTSVNTCLHFINSNKENEQRKQDKTVVKIY